MELDFYKVKNYKTIDSLKSKLFDEIQNALFVLTISTDNHYDIPFINDSAYKMFEILSDDTFTDTALSVYNQIHQEDKCLVKQSLIDSIKEKRWNLVFRAQLPTKGLCWFSISAKRELNSDGSIIFYGQITDVTDFKTQESRLKVLEEYFRFTLETPTPGVLNGMDTNVSSQKAKELELMKEIQICSEKNNRLLNFSHIVSHNLNSHVGNFKMLLDMIDLDQSFDQNRETMKYLRMVSNDLNKTIKDLSQIINVENNVDIIVKPLNLNISLNRVLNIVNAYSYRNSATIIKNIPEDATINFNPAYLESILQNLCTNAIKYANPNKFLIIEFNFFLEKGKKVLTIKDNGLGIDLEKYGHLLFGMYKTFHRHEEANGIGLYITKSQIESMNGTVTVESEVGKGTTFKIIFND